MSMPILWLLEDHLSEELPLLKSHPNAPVLMIESDRAFRRVPFHQKRIVFLCSAMRHFAETLRQAGRDVIYYPLKSRGYKDSLAALAEASRRLGSRRVLVTEPSEYHTRAWVESLPQALSIDIEFDGRTLFLTDRKEFSDWVSSQRSPVMENFYRRMRTRHGVLMDSERPGEPEGGSWNLDVLNRRPAPAGLLIPSPPTFEPDATTKKVQAEVARRFAEHPGSVEGFDYAVTRGQALRVLKVFIKTRLGLFGDFEDAMVTGQPVLFHSVLSPLINAGLLSPMECIRAAEKAFAGGTAPLNAVEGFVRQILGWREYVYGIYWSFMPEYRERNTRGSRRLLPSFYWDGQCEMNCLRQTLGQLLDRAHTHHIQRLMVLCNFATLSGLSPQAMSDWFLAMYVDSHDWVVVPNVVGMGMNADAAPGQRHGFMATKPYVSSAAYIHRMSDYCRGCRFAHDRRTGDDACPFNFLYWTFLHRYRRDLEENPRTRMMVRHLDRIDPSEMKQMMLLRKRFIESLESQVWQGYGRQPPAPEQ